MLRSQSLFLSMFFIASSARAGTITLNFEGFANNASLTNQYAGFQFTNTRISTAGLSLNEIEFPAHSGTNVVTDLGGPISIAFTSPVLTFSGFFTYSSALTIFAFDSLNQAVGTTNSAFASNFVSSGNPAEEYPH